jgi:hypothetical protein
MKDALWQSD